MPNPRDTAARELGVHNGEASTQQGLVKRLSRKTISASRYTIPGGKYLAESVDSKHLLENVYTWLRITRDYVQVTISFAKDLDTIKTRQIRVLDFNNSSGTAPWLVQARGVYLLAEQITDLLKSSNNTAAIIAKADGVYILQDTEKALKPGGDNWEPYVEFVPRKKGDY